MLEEASVVVVIPARNEAPRIGAVLAGLPPFVDRVIVVDDGSADGTSDVASARAEGDTRVTILRNEVSCGVGAAIVRGYEAALAEPGSPRDAFVVMAGDGQMDPRDLLPLVGPIVRGEADYVKGNRFLSEDARAMPIARRVAGEALSIATSIATGLRVRDSQCGYTAISRAAAASLDLRALWPRYGYPNDLLAMLAAARMRVREVVVRPIYRGEPSGVRPRHVLRILWLLARRAVSRR